jgi:para-aminobenzoate synthetase / 4-amino-4-deoxychorismate lyase
MTAESLQAAWHPLPRTFRVSAAQAYRSVLLETAKSSTEDDRSFLFLHPLTELIAWKAQDLEWLMEAIDRHLASGLYVAGYFSYECGESFVGLATEASDQPQANEPLAWLGVFEKPIKFRHRDGALYGGPLPDTVAGEEYNAAELISDGLQISKSDYCNRIKRVQEYLAAGHSYQVNFTDRIRGRTQSSHQALYETMLRRQPVSFAGYINHATSTILSFSPEMFYCTSQGKITVRPMKGTWPRGVNLDLDRRAEQLLVQDEKNRSEHVTIVDLMRNDVGRICTPGTVEVEKLFSVERYNTLLQMTSTISGSLQDQLSPAQVFRSLFPAGSITGAPKRRTMEIIRELESQPRGIYTGAIGYFAPGGEACFNVAIRTMTLKGSTFRLGVGGGITLDSNEDMEYEECLLKGSFITRERPPFSLLETIRCSSDIPLLDLHMSRLASSAAYFGIHYNDKALRADLLRIAKDNEDEVRKIRVELSEGGEWKISVSPLDDTPWLGRVLLASTSTDSQNVFIHHKTTNRKFYDDHLAAARDAGFDEVLFRNEKDQLTECAISNIFVFMKGRWFTPALSCGVLPGVQRTIQLQSSDPVIETELSIQDLQHVERFVVCNALRGVRQVYEIWNAADEAIWLDPAVRNGSDARSRVARSSIAHVDCNSMMAG